MGIASLTIRVPLAAGTLLVFEAVPGLRGEPPVELVARLETGPGEQAQADWLESRNYVEHEGRWRPCTLSVPSFRCSVTGFSGTEPPTPAAVAP